TNRLDARRRLGGDDAAVAVSHDHGRLVPLGQGSAHRGDVLGQPGTLRSGRPAALAAARQRRGNAADAALLQGRGGPVPPPRSVANARPVHKDNTHLFLLDPGVPATWINGRRTVSYVKKYGDGTAQAARDPRPDPRRLRRSRARARAARPAPAVRGGVPHLHPDADLPLRDPGRAAPGNPAT